jgi:hypothetical protein
MSDGVVTEPAALRWSGAPFLRTEAHALWEHSRNSLGIARLLVNEGRPEALVATACWAAVENACRAALEHCGAPFDGDLERAFQALSGPPDLLGAVGAAHGPDRVSAAERLVAWIARFLKAEAPDRAWGF